MPKKGKRKGKKGGKTGKKESVVKLAIANAKIWEAKLDIADKTKQEFRENAKRLMLENDALQTQMFQAEKDTIDVITFLKKQDQDKDAQLESQQRQIRDLKKEHRKEKETIIEDFSKQINELEKKLGQKMKEIDLMHSELKLVKEFRRKRGQIQKELEDIKEALQNTNSDHKFTIGRMEGKFFEEKMRLQQEANQKIAQLAEKAHTEVIANLDETTKSVYKENVRLSEALNIHMNEEVTLRRERDRLMEENKHLQQEKEVADMIIKKKVMEAKQQKEAIKELNDKIKILEKSLGHVVREFETERKAIIQRSETENQAGKVEIAQLQRVIELKTREMNKVKRLAKNILDERTELERFFLLSLEQVKAEVASNRSQYLKDAQAAYQHKMLAAHMGKGDYPKIRTFNQLEHSTNSVFQDVEAAEMLYDVSGKIDISDLTWEQKERVLRLLFAKMNGNRSKPSYAPLPDISKKKEEALSVTNGEERENSQQQSHTFLTQAHLDLMAQIQKHGLLPSQAT